jgi:hypothetical protein
MNAGGAILAIGTQQQQHGSKRLEEQTMAIFNAADSFQLGCFSKGLQSG